MDKFKDYIRRIVTECVHTMLQENKVVTFDGEKVYPDYGHCVIMGGGSGSGKGYVINRQLPLDGKIMDVDHFKELYLYGQKGGFIDDPNSYKLDNPDDVFSLHKAVSSRGWKDAQRSNFFKAGVHSSEKLPNVIFDITGKTLSDISEIVNVVKPMGYKVIFVWAVTNRSMALFRNLKRKRVVPQHVFHAIHNACNEFIPKFLKGGVSPVVNELDAAWLAFGSGNNLQQNAIDNPCIRLVKTSNGFEIPQEVEEQILDILGPKEEDPSNPKTYLPSDVAKSKMYTVGEPNEDGEYKWKTDEYDFLNKNR